METKPAHWDSDWNEPKSLEMKNTKKLCFKNPKLKVRSACVNAPLGDQLSTLNRLREFCELFLSDGLNSEFAYQLGLQNV